MQREIHVPYTVEQDEDGVWSAAAALTPEAFATTGDDPDDLDGDRPRRGDRGREPMDLLQEGNPPPTARTARSGRGRLRQHHTGREERGRSRGD